MNYKKLRRFASCVLIFLFVAHFPSFSFAKDKKAKPQFKHRSKCTEHWQCIIVDANPFGCMRRQGKQMSIHHEDEKQYMNYIEYRLIKDFPDQSKADKMQKEFKDSDHWSCSDALARCQNSFCTLVKKSTYENAIAKELREHPQKIKQCKHSADCIKVSAGCCSCTTGGSATAINKDTSELHQATLGCAERAICPTVMSDHWTCEQDSKPACKDQKCVLEQATAE